MRVKSIRNFDSCTRYILRIEWPHNKYSNNYFLVITEQNDKKKKKKLQYIKLYILTSLCKLDKKTSL